MNSFLKQIISRFIDLTTLEKLEKIFFALFLLSIPLQTRKTFITPETYLNGQFNEYTTYFIYLSDIFLIITFFLYFVNYFYKISNNLTKISKIRLILSNLSTYLHSIPIFALLLFVSWVFLNILWAKYSSIAFYYEIKLLELSFLTIYVSKRLYWFGVNKLALMILAIGNIESIIGITQYIHQESLGLKILGESNLAPNIDNVAKIVMDGERIVRAYGTFPHPNVFGAFLILSISFSFWLLLFSKIKDGIKKLFHVKQFDFLILNNSYFNNYNNSTGICEVFLFAFLMSSILLQFTALILTFSRIAWIDIILLLILNIFFVFKSSNVLYLKQNIKIVSRETILILKSLIPKLFHVKQFWKNSLNKTQKYSTILVFIIFIITALLSPQINSRSIDIKNKYRQSIEYRILYNNIAIKIIKGNPITGIGSGNFTLIMKDYASIPLEWWQYQPSHNIYLLITSETGLIGLIIFLFFIYSILKAALLNYISCTIISPYFVYFKKLFQVCFLKISHLKERLALYMRIKLFYSPSHLLKLFHVKQFDYYSLNKPLFSLGLLQQTSVKQFKQIILTIFISFLVMGLFDHYFWTLQQGRLIFWLVIGILLSPKPEPEAKEE